MYDTSRLRLLEIKRKLKDELEDKSTLQKYDCPNCNRKYSALDAMRLISMEDDAFHCERCNGVLVAECNKISSKDIVDGGDNVKRRQRQRLQFAEALMDQINRVKDLPFPVYESFPEWEARAAIDARENGDFNTNDPLRSQSGYGSITMPFLGETKVEVNLGEGKEEVKSEDGVSSIKPMPQWMIRQGMNLTKEQRGEAKVDGVLEGAVKLSDDNKPSAMENDNDTYLQVAYYAALLQQQVAAQKLNQQESSPDIQSATTNSDRQVGMKSKREEEDAECEEGPHVSANGADAEEEEDGVEWEEG
ncbi:hypothetical protein N665_1739s0006 [Sinapis alba]|nr:hypothetical protein N665_1739s0006 [Sinapis alba]